MNAPEQLHRENKKDSNVVQLQENDPRVVGNKALSAKIEPFDSYWQAPKDVAAGYKSFFAYYKTNYLPHMPSDKNANILVISCGPGYLVNMLNKHGYTNVFGIDSDADKIAHATSHKLNCETAEAFPFLANSTEKYDVILPEQELNHMTLDEQLLFLQMCKEALNPGGYILVYGLNGANPFVGSQNLTDNIDHFNLFTEYSLKQTLGIAGYHRVKPLPLKIYVFWKNPLNYVGLAITSVYELYCRIMFKLYGKNVKILSKKIAALAYIDK